MNTFQLKKEKLKQLTLEDIRKCGWNQIRERKIKTFFEKDNYILCTYLFNEEPIINIVAKDPLLIDWMIDFERFKISIKCPTKEMFEIITSLL